MADNDDDFVTFIINCIVGLIVIVIEIGVEIATMCFLGIAFVLEMIFDWGGEG